MSVQLSELLEANRRFAATFDAGDLPRPPRRPIAILTCLDARLAPEWFLGLQPGEVNVLRNAGGRVTSDVIRSLVVSGWLLGTRTFLVVHHTDCGLQSSGDDAVRALIAGAGGDPGGTVLHSFQDLQESVREDVLALRASAALPPDATVVGLIYDVTTGELSPVEY